jgi:hypothetical protein
VTLTVLGAAARPVSRAGARPGDALYVTGRLGGPLRALRAFEAGEAPDPADRARFAQPEARIAAGRWLGERGARALVDVSDGLAADLAHVAAASGVRCVVDGRTRPRRQGRDRERRARERRGVRAGVRRAAGPRRRRVPARDRRRAHRDRPSRGRGGRRAGRRARRARRPAR